jgi:hypothetical protein
MKIFKKLGVVVCGLLMTTLSMAQGAKASPADSATGNIKGATITIRYSSPSVKGRTIWGALVPYDKVWRAGANSATIFETDKEIKVAGKSLPAGKYSLYALVGEKEWTIIFNSQTGQWGITRAGETTEDPAKDVLRVTVKPTKSAAFNERLLYVVDGKGFSIRWENLEVSVPIK